VRTIVISEVEEGDFTIIQGGKFISQLTCDECLVIIVKMLVCPSATSLLPNSLQSYWQMEMRIREEILSKLRPVDRLTIQQDL
jgi:hypothetical protein